MSEPRRIAVVRTLAEMMAAYEERFRELQVTQQEIDRVSGLPDGYTNKVMRGNKGLGPLLFQSWNSTAGVMWQMIDDPDAIERHTKQLKRAGSQRMLGIGKQTLIIIKTTPKKLKKWAIKGGHARAAKLPRWRRKQIARKAARARWRKEHKKCQTSDTPASQQTGKVLKASRSS